MLIRLADKISLKNQNGGVYARYCYIPVHNCLTSQMNKKIFRNTLLSYFVDNNNPFRALPSLQDFNIRRVTSGFLRGGTVLTVRDTGDSTCVRFDDISFLKRRRRVFVEPAFEPSNIG